MSYPQIFSVSPHEKPIIQRAIDASNTLFACATTEKEQVVVTRRHHRGWECINDESETFLFGQENGRYSNIWPSSFEHSSRKDLLHLFQLLFKKGDSELKKIDVLRNKNFTLEDPRIKVSKYFKQNENKIVCGEHVDYGLITLIISDANQQLEFEQDGKWKAICNSELFHFIVLTGNQMEEMTGGSLRAIKHQVVGNSSQERLSFSLFLDMVE